MSAHVSVPLYTQLANSIHRFDTTDYRWRNMVHDHYFVLRDTGILAYVSPEIINAYVHVPDEYLKDIHKVSPQLEWIFLFMNNIPSRMSFNWDVTEVYVPDEKFVTKLYDTYRSRIAASKKNL